TIETPNGPTSCGGAHEKRPQPERDQLTSCGPMRIAEVPIAWRISILARWPKTTRTRYANYSHTKQKEPQPVHEAGVKPATAKDTKNRPCGLFRIHGGSRA